MVVVNDGLKNVRKFLTAAGGNPPEALILGTDNTTPEATDSALHAPVSSTQKTWDTRTIGDYTIEYEYTLSSTEGNGFNFKELGLVDTVGDSLYSRNTFTAINKDNNTEIQVNYTLKLKNGE